MTIEDNNFELRTHNAELKQGIRLLLVDDEENFRSAIARRLERRGIVSRQADSGEACLAVLQNDAVDVVVMDVKMPGMSGIDALKKIKQTHPKLEVILLTGQASTQDGVDGIKAGAFDYLTKPVELEQLIEKIKQAHQKRIHEDEREKAAAYKARVEQQMIATERLASLGTLAMGVAHEINNPLAIIQESAGWMNQLLKRKELENLVSRGDFEKALGKIETAVERVKRITHQLLGFVRKQDSPFSSVDLSELAGEAVELVSREALRKQIEIIKKTDTALEDIWSDPYQLRQVFINLLTNAIHATPAAGRITIIIEDHGEEVVLKIQDTGVGIPKENLNKIFEPFFSTKNPGEGTGLGLFVTRGIADKLGGSIQVESRIGLGATFTVRLPKHHPREGGLDDTLTSDPFDELKESGRP